MRYVLPVNKFPFFCYNIYSKKVNKTSFPAWEAASAVDYAIFIIKKESECFIVKEKTKLEIHRMSVNEFLTDIDIAKLR